MIRSSSRYEWLSSLGLALVSCQQTHNLTFETAPLGSDPPRQAPAVAVDPAPALPAPTPSAMSSEQLVVLQAPPSEHADEVLVEEFFDAVTARDSNRLEHLFEVGAKTKTSAKATEVDALDFWKSRISRLDYSKLAGQSIYRRHAVEVYTARDLQTLGSERSLPVDIGSDQVAVRIPLHSPQSDKTRLFGNELVFLLTPTDDGLKISEIVEDFQLP